MTTKKETTTQLGKVLDDLLDYLKLPDKMPAQGTPMRRALVRDFASRLAAAHHTVCVVLGYVEGMKMLSLGATKEGMTQARERGVLAGMMVVLEQARNTLKPSNERLSSLLETVELLEAHREEAGAGRGATVAEGDVPVSAAAAGCEAAGDAVGGAGTPSQGGQEAH